MVRRVLSFVVAVATLVVSLRVLYTVFFRPETPLWFAFAAVGSASIGLWWLWSDFFG